MLRRELRLCTTNTLSIAVHLWGEAQQAKEAEQAKESQQSGTKQTPLHRSTIETDFFGRVSKLRLMKSAHNLKATQKCDPDGSLHFDQEVDPAARPETQCLEISPGYALEDQAKRDRSKSSLFASDSI